MINKYGEIEWPTGDTCDTCGHDGMTFHLESHKDDEHEWFGVLTCAKCGEGEDHIIYDYQVPTDVRLCPSCRIGCPAADMAKADGACDEYIQIDGPCIINAWEYGEN